jgi:hypothetical protein
VQSVPGASAAARLFLQELRFLRSGPSDHEHCLLSWFEVAVVARGPIVCVPGAVMKRIREQFNDNAQ